MNMDCEMKTISVVIPCYNEEKSIREMYHRLKKIFEEELTQYDYEIIYVDDFSKDNTRVEIEKLCAEDEKVKTEIRCDQIQNFSQRISVLSVCDRGLCVHAVRGSAGPAGNAAGVCEKMGRRI